MLDNGVYELSFQHSGPLGAEFGDGLALVRDGRILGSDRFGGVFTGSCQPDPAGDGSLVELRLAIPPHAELITGFTAGADGATLRISTCLHRAAPVAKGVVEIAGEPIEVQVTYVGPLAA
jgi:hypothetical protein